MTESEDDFFRESDVELFKSAEQEDLILLQFQNENLRLTGLSSITIYAEGLLVKPSERQ